MTRRPVLELTILIKSNLCANSNLARPPALLSLPQLGLRPRSPSPFPRNRIHVRFGLKPHTHSQYLHRHSSQQNLIIERAGVFKENVFQVE